MLVKYTLEPDDDPKRDDKFVNVMIVIGVVFAVSLALYWISIPFVR